MNRQIQMRILTPWLSFYPEALLSRMKDMIKTQFITYKILTQASPNPGPRTGNGLQPVRNQAAQQEVRGRQASEASSAASHHSPLLTLPPEPYPTHPPSGPWKNCLPQNRFLVPKWLGTTVLAHCSTTWKSSSPQVVDWKTVSILSQTGGITIN